MAARFQTIEQVEAEMRRLVGQIGRISSDLEHVNNWLLANATRLENPDEQDAREVPSFLAFYVAELAAAKQLLSDAQNKIHFVSQPFASDEKNRQRSWGLRLKDEP